ncbi:hypothetical protein Patl1_33528 [Pistacia atlantica]|uniref:Uncharacterized protein n=1 Tax=Pistacia atlantica TaxID=434234 RepID=A0ACC0ZR81_9ROSI|nr:hypothetical protein Patl1_33528 [Pistacia atlantica]
MDLRGKLPEFHSCSPLQVIGLSATSFYGELPLSIGNLHSLEEFFILDCNFRGYIPSSFENLTQLKVLELSYNNFSVQTLSSLPFFGKLTQLISLKLDGMNLHGEIPSSIARLTNLEYLSLHDNQLVGSIPSKLTKLAHLKLLDLSSNKLEGLIPNSISDLRNIEHLFLRSNSLSGLVKLEMFLMLKHLTTLLLSFNNLTVLTSNAISNSSLVNLGLASCNLDNFPSFLNNQDRLKRVDLSHNHINGQIPKSVLNSSVNTLMYLNLSYNSLTSFDQHSVFLPWKHLITLDLSFNMLKGSVPIPPTYTCAYFASNNRLVGEISPLICNLTYLWVLDLSNNNLDGVLPNCLGNFSNFLEVLNLQNNSLRSHIAETFTNECKLKFVDLSHNQLHGEVPRSLVNCTKLEFLDLGNNYICDIFPSWLGTLPLLRVISLSSNEFHGEVGNPVIGFKHFPNIHIIDLSHNNFRGKLPSLYFQTWEALKIIDADQATYMLEFSYPTLSKMHTDMEYLYTLTIHNKGMERLYPKIVQRSDILLEALFWIKLELIWQQKKRSSLKIWSGASLT